MKRTLIAFLLSSAICHPSSAFATEVKEVVSPGGIHAWLVEEHALPLIAVDIAFRDSGSAYDPTPLQGRASTTAALLMEGAGDMDSHAFNAALEDTATQLNFGIDDDYFRASLVALGEHKEQAFSYLAMALTKPRFDDSAIERVRGQGLSLLAQEEREPGYLLHRGWAQLAFPDHPYSNPELGTPESLNSLKKDDFINFTHRYLTHENMVIAVVGDMTPAELGPLLDAKLGSLPEHYDPDTIVADTIISTKPTQKIIENDVPQTMVLFGENGIKRNDPNYYAAYVMNHILGGGGLSAKLVKEIREKRGLAYTASSQLEPMTHSAVWKGGFATRNEKVGSALQTLRTTLKVFSENGPTDQELTDAKQYLTGSFMLSLDSNADIAKYLINMQIYHLGRDYLNKRNSLIEAVTKEQVKAMAKKLVNPDQLLMVVVGKPNLEVSK